MDRVEVPRITSSHLSDTGHLSVPDIGSVSVPDIGSVSVPNVGPRPELPKLSLSDFGNGSDTAASPAGAPVKDNRTDKDLKLPPNENAKHPDLEIKLNDKSVKMRWSDDLGYVVIGEKNGSGDMHTYTPEEFVNANKEQLKKSGGGEIPSETTQKPEFFEPPEGKQSRIYRWDPAQNKDVIVGYRTDGERHYFQSQGTMHLVNAKADEAGLKPPERPLPLPGAIPKADDHNDGHIPMFSSSTKSDKEGYIWRWDSTAGRYCAVAERVGDAKDGKWHWFSNDEYKAKNSGPTALLMAANGRAAPVADGRGEMRDVDKNQFRVVIDGKADSTNQGFAHWGTPIYVYDKNTGHKVYIGARVDVGDGKTKDYYFDNQQMSMYNNYIPGENGKGKGYWTAKPLGDIDPKSRKGPPPPPVPSDAESGDPKVK